MLNLFKKVLKVNKWSFLFILVLFLVGSCSSKTEEEKKRDEFGKRAVKTVYSVFDEAKVNIMQKYPVVCVGVGAEMFGGPVQRLMLSFSIDQKLTKDSARQLVYNIAVEFLNTVNNSQLLQEFLVNKPFTMKDIETVLFIHDEKGNRLVDPDICVASMYNGDFEYDTNSPVQPAPYLHCYHESYEEAMQELNKAQIVQQDD